MVYPSLIWHLIAEEPLEVFQKMRLKNSCQLEGKNTLLNLFDSIAELDLWEEGNGIYLLLILVFLLLFLGCSTAICVLRWRNQRKSKSGCRSSPASLNSSKFSTETIATANTGSATTKTAVVVNWNNQSEGRGTNILRPSPPTYRCATVARRPHMGAEDEVREGVDGMVRMYGSQSSTNIFAGQQLRPQNGQQFHGKTASNTMNRKRPKCTALRVQKQPSSNSSCQIPANMFNALQQQQSSTSNWNSHAYCTLTQPYEYEEICAAQPPNNHSFSPTIPEDSEATVFEDLSENLRYMDTQRRPPPISRPPPPPRLTAKPYVILPAPPIDAELHADTNLISSSASSSAVSSSSDAELERLATTAAISSPPSMPMPEFEGRGLTTRSRTSSELGGSTVVVNGGRESGYGTGKSRRHKMWTNQQHVQNSPQMTVYSPKQSEFSPPTLPARSNSIEARRTIGIVDKNGGMYATPPPPQRLQSMTYRSGTLLRQFTPPPDYFESYVPHQRSVGNGAGMFSGGIGQAISSGFAGFPASLTGSSGLRRTAPPFSSFRGGYLPPSSPPFVPYQSPYLQQHHLLAAVITDKDNFQAQGCGWDGVRQRCTDILGICKGGCRDFSLDLVTHDCRCVPFGYAALYNGSIGQTGKKKKKR
uniref:Uncharacterized protein n=1 Tax=Ditylenchus dipsaci TaxID=166011 RepID=A0A915EB07_9BILA